MLFKDYKDELELGSPRNITVKVLNANTFFTLDYDHENVHDAKNKTNGFHLDREGDKQKRKLAYVGPNNSFNIKNVVMSAQYNRKNQSATANFRGLNLYSRIKKVDAMIEEQKRIINTSLDRHVLQKQIQEKMTLPEVKPLTERKKQKIQEQLKYQNYLFDTLPAKQKSSCEKKEEKHFNSFCDNYKNRRKLADRITQKKVNKSTNMSPLRRAVNPIEFAENHAKDSKHWSPYKGKLIANRNLEFLRQSIQGNQIKYSSPDPERYKAHSQQKQI